MTTRDLVWLDLCSGLGGASQPAKDRDWRVIRVDIDARFKPDIVADVRALPLRPFHVDVLWASPPCDDFSKWGLRCFFSDPPVPDLSILQAINPIIAALAPRFWVVENVWAARPWCTKEFGAVRARPPGHALWSNLGFLLPPLKPHKGSAGYWRTGRWGPSGHGPRWGTFGTSSGGKARGVGRRNASESAKIPYEIGEAICRAVEQRLGI